MFLPSWVNRAPALAAPAGGCHPASRPCAARDNGSEPRIVRHRVYPGRGGRCAGGGMRGRRGAERLGSPRAGDPGPLHLLLDADSRRWEPRAPWRCGARTRVATAVPASPRRTPGAPYSDLRSESVKRGHQLEPGPALCVLLGVLLWKINFNPTIKPKSEKHIRPCSLNTAAFLAQVTPPKD